MDAVGATINFKLSDMLDNFLIIAMLTVIIIAGVAFVFRNDINDFLFEVIEAHPDKAIYLRYEKAGRKIAQVWDNKSLERARLAVNEFEATNKNDFTGQYYAGKLQNMLRQKELKLSVDNSKK